MQPSLSKKGYTQAGPRAGFHLNCMYNYMQHRVQNQLLLPILVLPWCDEAIYLCALYVQQADLRKEIQRT